MGEKLLLQEDSYWLLVMFHYLSSKDSVMSFMPQSYRAHCGTVMLVVTLQRPYDSAQSRPPVTISDPASGTPVATVTPSST